MVEGLVKQGHPGPTDAEPAAAARHDRTTSRRDRGWFSRCAAVLLVCVGCGSSFALFHRVRLWQHYWTTHQDYIGIPEAGWYSWLVLGTGVLLTLSFAGLFWRMTRINRDLLREAAGRRQAQAQLALAGKLFESSGEAIIITDASNKIVSVNQAFTAMTGYVYQEIAGRNPRLLRSRRHNGAFYREMWQQIRQTGGWQGEIWNRKKNGQDIPLWVVTSAIPDDCGQVTNYVSVASDMSQRKAAEERIEFLAYYDALTGLPNRTLLRDRLQQAIAHARRYGTNVALMFLDLDRFKNINDSLGHSTGDLLLQEVAGRLKAVVRQADTVARMGGDEFMIVLSHCSGRTEAASVAERIQQDVSRPYTIQGKELTIEASIGISIYPTDGVDIDYLMSSADVAMYQSKRGGQGVYQFYSADVSAETSLRLQIENELRRALDQGELFLHFQPQVLAATGEIIGAEALVRWQHPEKGLISPADFIPIAEESGLIVPIGEWVLKEACRWNARWQRISPERPIPVAVNVSAVQFRQQGFKDMVLRVLASSGLSPQYLELELTESAFVNDAGGPAGSLAGLKDMGVRLSIDDFGTGYSSLIYLKRFPLDRLKICQLFVRDLNDDADDAAIVTAIIQMGKSLGLRVVAEGVETPEQLAFLREHGCDEIQGYLFARPMPPEEVAEKLKEKSLAVGV